MYKWKQRGATIVILSKPAVSSTNSCIIAREICLKLSMFSHKAVIPSDLLCILAQILKVCLKLKDQGLVLERFGGFVCF